MRPSVKCGLMLNPRLLSPQAFRKCRLLAWSSAKQNTLLSHYWDRAIKPSAIRTQFRSWLNWTSNTSTGFQYCWCNLAGEAMVTDPQQHFRLLMPSRCHNRLQSLPITFSCSERKKKKKTAEGSRMTNPFSRICNKFTKCDSSQMLQRSGFI